MVASRTTAMSQREAGRTTVAAVRRRMGKLRGRVAVAEGVGPAAGRACGPQPTAGAAAKDGQATAKARVALAHQCAATCACGPAERGHGKHWNAVTAYSRPNDQTTCYA